MRLTKARGDPDHDLRVEAGEIREALAEVAVIGSFELILDDGDRPGLNIPGEDVGREGTDRGLGTFELELQPGDFVQAVEILGEPRREDMGFVPPDFANVDDFETGDGWWIWHEFNARLIAQLCGEQTPSIISDEEI